jgi:hypothetical protein
MFKSTQIGDYNDGEWEFGRGSLGAILWLIGDEVFSPASKGSAPLSCWVASWRNTLFFHSATRCLTKLGSLSPLLWEPSFRLYPKKGRVQGGLGAMEYGLHAPRSRRVLLWHGWTSALLWSQGSASITWCCWALTIDRQWFNLHRLNLLEAFLAVKAPQLGADEWALEPSAPGAGEVVCFVVSHSLGDHVEGVADSASRSLIEPASQSP